MMNVPESAGRRRETRLLLATIAVSVGMLLVLARFRFPEEAARQTVEPSSAPLERLAARATYDELAGVMADLERRITASVVPIATQGEDGTRYAPAVRIAPDRAVALLPADRRLTSTPAVTAPPVVSRDVTTELLILQAPSQPEAVPPTPPIARAGPRYLAAVEATGNTTAVRPVYVGRTDLFLDPRWPDPLMSVAAVQQTLPYGSAVFSLDGSFLGLATEAGGQVAIVPAGILRNAASGTLSTASPMSELPVEVQPLTAALARAAGVQKGIMVSYVSPAVSTDLMPGDVIQSVDGVEVSTVTGFRLIAHSRTPDSTVTLQIVRRGEQRTAAITARRADADSAAEGQDPGVVLRNVAGVGAEVITVRRDSPAERAGLRRGDLILSIGGAGRTDAAALRRAFRGAKPGQSLLLTIRRDSEQRMVALEKQ